MVFLMFSDNADAHHTVGRGNFPTLVIGNGGGALKTEGRYVAFAQYSKAQASLPARPIAELMA
jgi:hypothetical protein